MGGLAVQVWAVSVAWGSALGAAGALVVALTLIAANGPGADIVTCLVYVGIVAGIGGQLGAAVGIVVGLALGLVVKCGQRALGPRVVARLLPVVAVALTTLPFVIVIAFRGAPAPAIGILLLDAAFTAIGGLLVARYYLRRGDTSCVH
jgi:hypothetical protein